MRSGLRLQVGSLFSRSGYLNDVMTAGTKDIQIVVNGQVRDVPGGKALAEILVFLEIDPSRVAVELNRSIVVRRDWDKAMVASGATLEIVQFVGGG